MRLVVAAAILLGGCAKPPVTLVPVPDEENRVEVRTADPGWERRAGDLAACVLRVGRAGECARAPDPPVCDSRTKEEALRSVQPIVDSLPKVRLGNAFAMNRDLRALFPSATPTTEVLDARRRTPCADWSGGACAAIRTAELAFLFEGAPGAAPERVLIFRVAPACRESRPDGGNAL
ncbi:MAG: hypothetical protein HOP28_02765 [Gemmatimonadales bacterium]|nr:hypothetical protein [Gemmatimonadales bacterium]